MAAFFASLFRRGGGDRLLFASQQQSRRFSPSSLRGAASSSLSNRDESSPPPKTAAGRLQSLVTHLYPFPPRVRRRSAHETEQSASERHQCATVTHSLSLPEMFGFGIESVDTREHLWKPSKGVDANVTGFYLADRPFVLVADERDLGSGGSFIFAPLLQRTFWLAMRVAHVPLIGPLLFKGMLVSPVSIHDFSTRCRYKSRLFWQKCHIDWQYGPSVFNGAVADGYSVFNSDVFFAAVRTILDKLKANDAESLVRENLLTGSALKAMEANLRKLTADQKTLLDVQTVDFVHSDVPIVDMSVRHAGDESFLDILLHNVAIYQSHLIDRNEAVPAACSGPQHVLAPSYPLQFPPLVHVNLVFSRRIRPSVAPDFLVSQFNVIAICCRPLSLRTLIAKSGLGRRRRPRH